MPNHLIRGDRLAQRFLLYLLPVGVAVMFLLAASSASATQLVFCNHEGSPGQSAMTQCGPAPRHSLTFVGAEVTGFSEGTVCADSENEDGSFNHYFCGFNLALTGEYCGCNLKKGYDKNGAAISLTMIGFEDY